MRAMCCVLFLSYAFIRRLGARHWKQGIGTAFIRRLGARHWCSIGRGQKDAMANAAPLERLQVLTRHVLASAESACLERGDASALPPASSPAGLLSNARAGSHDMIGSLSLYWHGSKESERHWKACGLLRSDPHLVTPILPYELTSAEQRERCMRQIVHWQRMIRERKVEEYGPLHRALISVFSAYDRSWGMRIGVHMFLFRVTMASQGTPEQAARWVPLVDSMKVLGCFAMTELGHSSFLRGIETTAVFDKDRDEFVIHSPSDAATKWWIGMAGKTATHTVALAQLIIDDTRHGLHWFIVPLRHVDGRCVEGVECGDVGPKLGRHGLDSGWIRFTHKRIPRENMLMRWSKIDRDGSYQAAPHPAIAYGTLVGERVMLVSGIVSDISQALTITVRFLAARSQGSPPRTLLSFPFQQKRVMPILSVVHAARMNSRVMEAQWDEHSATLQEEGREMEFLVRVQHIHGIASGIKAWVGWWAADSLEELRRSLGGHGYAHMSGLPIITNDFGVATQGGGAGVVVAQQHAKYVLHQARLALAKRGNAIEEFAFITRAKSTVNLSIISEHGQQCAVMESFAAYMIERAITALDGENPGSVQAWDANITALLDASRAHVWMLLVSTFGSADGAAQEVVSQMRTLMVVDFIKKHAALFMECGMIERDTVSRVEALHTELAGAIAKHSVVITDAFGWPDWALKAPVANYDGELYSAMCEAARTTRDSATVAPYWDELVRPLLDANACG